VKEAFIERTFRAAASDSINKANTVIAEYARQSYRLTLRQSA
jgi:hypothetical protein